MLDSVQEGEKEKPSCSSFKENSIFQLKGKITLALFPEVLSPLKYFLKKEPQSNSNIC